MMPLPRGRGSARRGPPGTRQVAGLPAAAYTPNVPMNALAQHPATGPGEFATIGWLLLVVAALVATILVLTHVIGPRRSGPVKNSTYESGMDPIGDTRRRFSVQFYLIAVLFLIFDVEVVFLYPWAVLFGRLRDPGYQDWAGPLLAAGYSPAYLLVAIGVFFALLLVGFIYEWRRGVFKWN